jgi:hypothetical protein
LNGRLKFISGLESERLMGDLWLGSRSFERTVGVYPSMTKGAALGKTSYLVDAELLSMQ